MSDVTIEKIAKTVEEIVKQELQPIKTRLDNIETTQGHHTIQLDGIAKDVKMLMDNKTVVNHRLDRVEKWGIKAGERLKIKLEL